MDLKWNNMYNVAMGVINRREISRFVEAGSVAAAVESGSGKIYTGVCVDSACTLGICAERNALFNMITNGEDTISRVIAVNSDGKALAPCGACREFMIQLMPDSYSSIEIMLDYEYSQLCQNGFFIRDGVKYSESDGVVTTE